MGEYKRGYEKPGSKREAWFKFVNGEEEAFEVVFKKYYKSLFGYGIEISRQPEIVKDSIQELFSYLWEHRKDLNHVESPYVYLFVSLRRKVLGKIKEAKKTDGDINKIDENKFLELGKDNSIIIKETKLQNKKKLDQAMNQLSKCQREVIYLHFYEGMSYREIGKILSINRQSVRNHVYRAMQTLRSFLDIDNMRLVI